MSSAACPIGEGKKRQIVLNTVYTTMNRNDDVFEKIDGEKTWRLIE